MPRYLFDKETGKSLLVTEENVSRVREAYNANKDRYELQMDEYTEEPSEPMLRRGMTPEAREEVLRQEGRLFGQPLTDFGVRTLQTYFPESAKAMAETGSPTFSTALTDFTTVPTRALGELLNVDRMRVPFSEREGVISQVAGSPESAFSMGTGAFASNIAKRVGAGGLRGLSALALGEGTGDVLGKQVSGQEVTPVDLAYSYGLPMMGDVTPTALQGARDLYKRSLSAGTLIPQSTLEFATKEGSWQKLASAPEVMENLPDVLANTVRNAKPRQESITAVSQAVQEMPMLDVKPLVNSLKKSLPKKTTEVNEQAFNKINSQIRRLEDNFMPSPSEAIPANPMMGVTAKEGVTPKEWLIPASEYLKLRQDLDKAIDWDSFQKGSKSIVEKSFKDTRKIMKETLEDNAPPIYKEAMKDIGKALEAKENVKMLLGNSEWKDSKKARSIFNNILGSSRKEEREFIKAFDDYFGTDFISKAELGQMAQDFGGGTRELAGAPTLVPARRTGTNPVTTLLNMGTSNPVLNLLTGGMFSPALGTGVYMPALDVLKGASQTIGGRGVTQQFEEEAMLDLMGLQGENPYE